MCPSFKATQAEEHSTRGRANALRLAMSGQLDNSSLTNDAVIDALDLCLSCKACKSECPSNVDMAKLKSEVWQKKYDEKGISLRDRMVRDSAKMSARFSGAFANTINVFNKQSSFVQRWKKQWALKKREYFRLMLHKHFTSGLINEAFLKRQMRQRWCSLQILI